MNSLDKQAFKFGAIAAIVAALIPVLLQATLTTVPLASNVA